jgi:hypothetical protein
MKNAFIILLVSLACLQLNGQTKQEKILKYISIVNSEEMINKGFDGMLQFMKQQSSKDLTKEQQDEFSTFMMDETKNMAKKALTEFYPKVYDKYFTDNEIDELLKFYQSPTGQKFVKVTPDIQMEYMQNFMTVEYPSFQKKIAEKSKEIKERK